MWGSRAWRPRAVLLSMYVLLFVFVCFCLFLLCCCAHCCCACVVLMCCCLFCLLFTFFRFVGCFVLCFCILFFVLLVFVFVVVFVLLFLVLFCPQSTDTARLPILGSQVFKLRRKGAASLMLLIALSNQTHLP